MNEFEKQKLWKRMGKELKIGPGLKLSFRHRAFVAEYIQHWDATKAAESVGYTNPKQMGYLLVSGRKAPQVAEAIRRLTEKNEEKAQLTSDELLSHLSGLIKSSILDSFKNGWLVVDNPKDIPESLKPYIKKIDVDCIKVVDEDGNERTQSKVRIETGDKLKAVELLMRAQGLFAATQVNVNHGLNWDSLFERMKNLPDDREVIDAKFKKLIDE